MNNTRTMILAALALVLALAYILFSPEASIQTGPLPATTESK